MISNRKTLISIIFQSPWLTQSTHIDFPSVFNLPSKKIWNALLWYRVSLCATATWSHASHGGNMTQPCSSPDLHFTSAQISDLSVTELCRGNSTLEPRPALCTTPTRSQPRWHFRKRLASFHSAIGWPLHYSPAYTTTCKRLKVICFCLFPSTMFSHCFASLLYSLLSGKRWIFTSLCELMPSVCNIFTAGMKSCTSASRRTFAAPPSSVLLCVELHLAVVFGLRAGFSLRTKHTPGCWNYGDKKGGKISKINKSIEKQQQQQQCIHWPIDLSIVRLILTQKVSTAIADQ